MELSDRQVVYRFRWIMTGTMLLDIIVTLISQPDSYWGDRASAFESNSLFHFFLVQALPWSLILPLLYMMVSFAIVSVLPPKAALITVFSFIICHYFRVSCWLDYRWQFGMSAPLAYGLLLGELILNFAFTGSGRSPTKIVKKLRWLMIGVLIFDMVNTIAGQPASYWHDHTTANEGFPPARFFIMQGMPVYLLYNLVLFTFYFFLVTYLSGRVALVVVISIILIYYFGASTWINNGWKVSAEGPIIYGVIVSLVFVLLTFWGTERKSLPPPG